MTKKQKMFLWIDQYGYKYFAKDLKDLKKEVAPYSKNPHVSIMYQDKKDGRTVRVGHIINSHWLSKYEPVEIDVTF